MNVWEQNPLPQTYHLRMEILFTISLYFYTSRVFGNGPGDRGSLPGRVRP